MKTWKHMNIEHRKTISSCLSHNYNLINSRRGIDIDNQEFKKLDSIVKNGIEDNKSIYQIKIENSYNIDKSISTLYRYINKSYLTTKRIDLPRAVKYKKRKHNNILSFILPEVHFTIIDILKNPNSKKVVKFFIVILMYLLKSHM